MLEIMNRMNGRPITAIPIDAEDEAPLTPNDFLLRTENPTSYPGVITEQDAHSRSTWRKAMHIANQLWVRWLRDYLPCIARAEKWLDDQPPLKVGEVVMLAYPNDPWETWRRGVVEQVHPGKDGKIRTATVREASGKRKLRSVHTMARLSIRSQCVGGNDEGGDVVVPNNDRHPMTAPACTVSARTRQH